MADLLVATMQDAVIEVQSGGVAAVAPIPQPMFPGNWEIANPTCKLGVRWCAFSADALCSSSEFSSLRVLWSERYKCCQCCWPLLYQSYKLLTACRIWCVVAGCTYLQEAFKPTVVRSEGFEWKARKPKAATFDGQKWGWIGETEGAYVVLRLSTDVDRQRGAGSAAAQAGTPAVAATPTAAAAKKGAAAEEAAAAGTEAAAGEGAAGELARVWLSHVCSWVDHGTATVACVSGCTCANATLDHFWHYERTLSDLAQLEVGGWWLVGLQTSCT
jgi:hypothetical protein